MRIPKKYGQSRTDNCPFCGKRAITNNSQQVPVCIKHKDYLLSDLKCQCGDWLDVMSGKYGPFFNCLKCGNISFSRGMELNEERIKNSSKKASSSGEDFDYKGKDKDIKSSKSFLESLAAGRSSVKKDRKISLSSAYKPKDTAKKASKKSHKRYTPEKKETVVTSRDIDIYFS